MGGAQFSVFRLHPDLKGSHLDGYWVSDAELREPFLGRRCPDWEFVIVRLCDSGDDLESWAEPKDRAGVRPFAMLV